MQKLEGHPFLAPTLVLLNFHTNRRPILHWDEKYPSHYSRPDKNQSFLLTMVVCGKDLLI